MHTVGRWALRVPDGTDGPPNVPLWMDRLAVDLTDVAKDNQGTLGARPVSTALSPGTAGRYFVTTDELDGGAARRRVYRDFGLGWDELATVPISDRQIGAGALTEANMASGAAGLARGSFSAYRAAAVSPTTGSVVVFDTDTGADAWDVSAWYDTATGRFTPQVPGVYRFSWLVTANAAPAAGVYLVGALLKNGATAINGPPNWQTGAAYPVASGGSVLAKANGTTDFFQLRVQHNNGVGLALLTGVGQTFFQGHLVGRL